MSDNVDPIDENQVLEASQPKIDIVEDVETLQLENVWTTGRKFLISISIAILLLIGTAVVSILYINQIVNTHKRISEHTFVMKEVGLQMTAELSRHKAAIATFLRTREDAPKTEINDIRSKLLELINKMKREASTKDEEEAINLISEKLTYTLDFGKTLLLTDATTAAPSSETSEPSQPVSVDVAPTETAPTEIDLEIDMDDLGLDDIDLGLGLDDDLLNLDVDLGIVETSTEEATSEATGTDDMSDFDFDLSNEAFGSGIMGKNSSRSSLSISQEIRDYNLAYMELVDIINMNILEKKTKQFKIDNDLIDRDFFMSKLMLILFISVLILFNIGQFMYFNRSVTEPIKRLRRYLISMGRGELPEFKMKVWKDDIGEMVRAVKNLLHGLKQTAFFANELGDGNLKAEYNALSKGDILGTALMNMRDNLRQLADNDEKRNWANSGVADFSEILRKYNDNLDNLADQIIMYLVNYLKVNQGGVFLLNDLNKNDVHLELASIYAWDRKKFIEERIEKGQGLVGQCWYEQKTIFMTDVPPEFVKITSGLGEAVPRCILIVPLISNEEIYGVLELAAFKILEEYEVEFVEKVAESIGAAVSNVKITEKTKILLEEAQQQGEELRANEEEMRQNMEEMNATQEEMDRILQEKDVLIEKLNKELEEVKGK